MSPIEKRFVSLENENHELRTEILCLKNNLQYYQDQNDVLKRMLFGAKSEKSKTIAIEPHQLHLFEFAHFDLSGGEAPAPQKLLEKIKTKPAQKGRRRVRPELETVEIVISAPEDKKQDENANPLVLLGHENSERLHLVSAKLVRQIIKREIYGHKDSRDAVHTAPIPPAIVPKGKLSDSFVIQILVEKFFVGTPLYRLIRSFNAKGADLAKSTLSDTVQCAADFFAGIAETIRQEIMSSKYIHMDETPIKNQKKKSLDYFWVARNLHHCYVHYGDGRSGEEALRVLLPANREGPVPKYLMADDYGGYNRACEMVLLKRLACWSHVRRKFYDSAKAGNEIAVKILTLIKELYHVETMVKLECEKQKWTEKQFWRMRGEYRQKYSKAIIEKIKIEVECFADSVAPKSLMGEALRYMKKIMPNLQVTLKDGELPIDNNPAEWFIRLLVIGRKNFLFVGSQNAGRAAAICYTLTESCRMNQIDPAAYLVYVTAALHEGKPLDYKALTPHALADQIRKMPVNF